MIEFNARESYKVFCALLIDSRENLGLRTLQIRSYSFQSAIICPLQLPFDLNTLYRKFVQVITAKCESTSGVSKRVSQLQTSPLWFQTKISLSSVRVVKLQPFFPECCNRDTSARLSTNVISLFSSSFCSYRTFPEYDT